MIDDNDINKLKTIFATKDDLKRFATKDDLKRFATKDDLKRFATKDDLMTTKKALELAVARLDHRMDNLEEKIKENTEQSLTRFRSDIMTKLDQILSELVKSREEQEVLAFQVSNHEDRLVKIEDKLGFAS